MDYKLGKALKDAGYKMDYNFEGLSPFDKRTMDVDLDLRELIDSCGDHFISLYKMPSGVWQTNFIKGIAGETAGLTPEEAVARLWLYKNGHKVV